MRYFPFTFLFNVPGISNPFSSSTSTGAVASETSSPSDTKRLKRNFDASVQSHISAAPNQPRPPRPSRPQPQAAACFVRKKGWQLSSPIQPSEEAVIAPSAIASGVFNTTGERSNMNNANEDEDDVLDLPPAKRRKGLAESVISTAFNAALVGAAVGLTVFRLWTDKGKEGERTPPPPYQEEWSPPTPATTPDLQTPRVPPRVRKSHVPSSTHKRHAGSLRHRPKVVRKTVHIRRDIGSSSNKSPTHVHRDEFAERNSFTRSPEGDETLDEMDWIGERLYFLIEEGKRALGTEVVVVSESPEDEVDDGSGNWVEDDERDPSTPFGRARSKRPHNEVEVACSTPNSISASPRLSSFPSYSRFHPDDLSASLHLHQSTPIRSASAVPAPGENAATTTAGHLSKAYESESPSIRESMERARAAYLQKRGLGIHTPETLFQLGF